MKHKLLIAILVGVLASLPIAAFSQQTFTQHVISQKAGEGKVVIHTDAKTDSIINNTKPTPAKRDANDKKLDRKNSQSSKTSSHTSDTSRHSTNHHAAESRRHEETTQGRSHEGSNEEEAHTPRHTYINRERVRQTGYRIQIYTGGNSHQDKAKAYNIGAKCRKAFPELSAYPRFMSPRWICRVGDFRTREEALKYVRRIRAKRISREAHVVRCEVLLPK